MNNDYREEILKSALEARIREVTEYQVNIDNFRLAITMIADDPDLQDFKQHLKTLLTANEHEQKKAMIMLKVVQSQME